MMAIMFSYISKYNLVKHSSYKHVIEFTHFRQYQQKLNLIKLIKVQLMAGLLYGITIDCIGVSD